MLFKPHNGFFDESGTHNNSEIITVGGLISSYVGWSRFEIEWTQILKARGIKVFHFSEFMARQGEFANEWTNSERNQLMERLCTAVSDNVLLGLATSVFRNDYEAEVPKELQRQIKDPYYFGLYTCLWQVLTLEKNVPRVSLPKPVEFLFDRKKGYEGFASAIYYAIKEQFEQLGWDPVFGHMGFGSKEKDVPLQAADLLVGVVSRNRLRSKRKGSFLEGDMEKSLLTLGKSRRLLVSNAGPPELEKFVACFPPKKN
jgi:hypothetical protein